MTAETRIYRADATRARWLRIVSLVALLAVGACDAAPDPRAVVPYEEVPVPEDASDEDLAVTGDQLALEMQFLDVPRRVTLGSELRYVVELRNTGEDPVPLEPCPPYYQAWGESGFSVSRTSYLNCDEAPPDIPPGGRLRFEMRLPIEEREAVHVVGSIVWYLGSPEGERADVSTATVTDIVLPSP